MFVRLPVRIVKVALAAAYIAFISLAAIIPSMGHYGPHGAAAQESLLIPLPVGV